MLYKAFEFKAAESNLAEGEFAGYASTFGNWDTYGDIIQRGAFARTLPRFKESGLILWQHQMRVPIGKPLEAYEDEKGLFIRGKISDTTQGRDCLTLMRDGVVRKMSIGFDCPGYQVLSDAQARDLLGSRYEEAAAAMKNAWWFDGFRLLTDIDLYEVSPVSLPANDQADITAVKCGGHIPGTEREFEGFLRDAGFPRKAATILTGHGWKGLQRDAGADEAALVASLKQLTATLTASK